MYIIGIKTLILITLSFLSLTSNAKISDTTFCTVDWELRKLSSEVLAKNPKITLNEFKHTAVGKGVAKMYGTKSEKFQAAYYLDGKKLSKHPVDIEAAKAQCIVNVSSN